MTVSKWRALNFTILCSICATPAWAKPLQSVRIESGALHGTEGDRPDISVFRGIPYAAPPVGDLRFRAPLPAKRWKGLRDASRFGAVCPQHSQPPAGQSMGEDCLTANVWTAAQSAKERRPVFVWIYGGGFNEGTAANPQFDGEALARKGIVVVTFNYRLGPLGFLATPELSKESGKGASGNFGLLDDIALLKWVQRNITAFGGDPKQVTIGGQSAGAGSVGFLSVSPLAKGLFHRSIAQSHVRHPGDPELRFLSTSWRSLHKAETNGKAFAAARGATTVAELRALPWQKLLEASNVSDEEVDTGSAAKPPLFRPVVDGWVVPETYASIFDKGRQNPVSFIAGNNRDETGAVTDAAIPTLRAKPQPQRGGMPVTNVTLAAYHAWAQRKFGEMADEFLRLYPASNDDEAVRMNNQAARDNSRSSTLLWATEWRKKSATPIYPYFWTRGIAGPMRETRGAFHGSEIQFVFDSLRKSDLPWTDEDRKVADMMSSYWANYIATGNPNGPGLPDWPAWKPGEASVMELGTSFTPIVAATPERLDFWQRFFAAQPQW